MSTLRIDTEHMKYFLAVVKYKSFTKAAEQLYISQPAISRKVSQLEKQLEVELIDRSKRDFALTLAGERFKILFKEYINELEILQNQFKANRKEVIKFGIFHGWNIPNTLQSYIKEFHTAYPQVDVVLSSVDVSGLRQGLRDDTYEFIIGVDKMLPSEERLHKCLIKELHRVAVFHKTNPLAEEDTVTFQKLALQTCYLFRDHLMPLNEIVEQPIFKNRRMKPKVVMMDNLDSVITALACGYGFTVLDDLHHIVENQSFKHIQLPETECMYLAYKENKVMDYYTKQFLEHMPSLQEEMFSK
ncbi:LysR family transcriptional regulator [uncultured Veillonella sp.]|uniref:LysR family transcriptional regulator n=1 Tax=uncultured Veillonella sp. TaxID=159268 RepID=UPI002633E860|nr:LysR family transcriptional regulator [uncultured Veillonella sp.]